MLYDLSRKSRPEIVVVVRRPYDLYRSLNAPVPSICVLLYGQNKCNKFGRTKSVLYGFFLLLICLEIRALLCLGIRATFLLLFLLRKKMETSPSLALSQSLNLSWKE
jgi:hypothetical protein